MPRDKLQDFVRTKAGDTRQLSVLSTLWRLSAVYYGETAQGLERRLKDHESDLRHHKATNFPVLHVEEHGHLPRWENAAALHTKMERRKRKLVEGAYIANSLVANHRERAL